MIYFSRHNLVRAVDFDGRTAVRKHFADLRDWQAELNVLRVLSGCAAVPEVLRALPGFLLLEHLPFPTLLDELERQEAEGFCAAPWCALCRWLENAHAASGLVPTDGNLRNFLWDRDKDTLYGIDFEHYRAGNLSDAACEIAAFIPEYAPAGTPVKQQAAQILCETLNLSPDGIALRRAALLERRKHKHTSCANAEFSLILLAGGRSSRMGQDKASLDLLGCSFLETQLEKARMLRINDVLVSGARDISGVRCIPDELPDRGPLGGLHACLRQARHPHCIVLSIDTPLLPASALQALVETHLRGSAPVTLAVHDGHFEPLMGIYDAHLAAQIEPLIRDGGAPVRALLKETSWNPWEIDLPESVWSNCNTPEEYRSLIQTKLERI